MLSLFSSRNESFLEFLDSTPSVIKSMLKSMDIGGCLKNCSNNGVCFHNTTSSKLNCNCTEDYKGDACDILNSKCLTVSCKYNGKFVVIHFSFRDKDYLIVYLKIKNKVHVLGIEQ